jgi:8-oxo-dGTP pyrophosphatase MutT (NUDIX family)
MARSHKQAAVIPYRITRWRVEIALVRTSSGNGWTVPKGSLDKGESGCDAAMRETEEEAGLLGELTRRPIGRYRYTKQHECYKVSVYVMRVTIVLESWREADRGRRWMAVEEAMKRLPPELHPCVRETQRIARRRPGPDLGSGTARETAGGPRSLAGTPAAAARRPAVASA